MLIIVDKKIPQQAKENLLNAWKDQSCELLELETEGLVYPEISGHPDIFFSQTPEILIISPNLPEQVTALLEKQNIHYLKGQLAAGYVTYPETPIPHPLSHKRQKKLENRAMMRYNAAISRQLMVHRLDCTDPVILENCYYHKKIAVKQGYTRCNLLLLEEGKYVTSDEGIHKVLQRTGLKGLFVPPGKILLPGFPNGFIGGAMGVFRDRVFIIGNLNYLPEGGRVNDFLKSLDYRVIELYDGPLFDGGGILFIGDRDAKT
jgi:hypothetical protein